jgi:rubredoxin
VKYKIYETGILLGNKITKEKFMAKYICNICGYVYDPAQNNNVAFADLPEDWTCPECGAGKDAFDKVSD